MNFGIDWYQTWLPASSALLAGHSPYTVPTFISAPWALLAVLPLAWLPPTVGRWVWFFISLAAFAAVPWRLGASPVATVAFLLSPTVVHCLLNANMDWLPLLGLILPRPLGVFALAVKPQVGIGVLVFWLAESIHEGPLAVARLLAPVCIVTALSFAVFGWWPGLFAQATAHTWNASLWPYSLPVGAGLLVHALRVRRWEHALAAGPCLSPYVALHSWAGALLAIVRSPVETVAAVIGMWVMVIMRAI